MSIKNMCMNFILFKNFPTNIAQYNKKGGYNYGRNKCK